MALQFNDATNKSGIVQLFQDLTKTNTSSYPLAKIARDVNNALVNFKMLADRASRKWAPDDSNQTDYPIIKLNLVSGQWDYPFANDGSSTPNQILDIFRVESSDSNGTFTELSPYDISEETSSIAQAQTTSGTPTRYDKQGGSLFLDPKPNYSYTNGLWIWISRTPSYFAADGSDTTKKPGIPDMFHEYLVYRPAYLYAVTNLQEAASAYLQFLTKMEHDIDVYYTQRDRDEKNRFTLSKGSNDSNK